MKFELDKLKTIASDYAAAWSAGDENAVALFYAENGYIEINRGEQIKGRRAVAEMAAGFQSEFPDLLLHCDAIRCSGAHAVFLWTLEGHHVQSKKFVKVSGWEEWELDQDLKVVSSRGWYDQEDYDRQIEEGFQP